MQTVVSSSQDALHLLFKAAAQQDADEPLDSHRLDQTAELQQTHTVETPSFSSISLSSPPQEVLDLWNHSRFVRQGWLSARECVAYIDL